MAGQLQLIKPDITGLPTCPLLVQQAQKIDFCPLRRDYSLDTDSTESARETLPPGRVSAKLLCTGTSPGSGISIAQCLNVNSGRSTFVAIC